MLLRCCVVLLNRTRDPVTCLCELGFATPGKSGPCISDGRKQQNQNGKRQHQCHALGIQNFEESQYNTKLCVRWLKAEWGLAVV